MTDNERYNNLIKKLNDLQYANLMHKLNDLAEEYADDIVLDSATDSLTELEKALVCVALYWYDEGVKEDGNKNCGAGKNKNISEDKVVKTLSNNLSNDKIMGGEIGAFFETCFDWNIFSKGKGKIADNFIARNSSQNPSCKDGFVAWCAVFAGHCWIESLASLGFTDIAKSDKFYNVIEKSYGKVKVDYSDNKKTEPFRCPVIKIYLSVNYNLLIMKS